MPMMMPASTSSSHMLLMLVFAVLLSLRRIGLFEVENLSYCHLRFVYCVFVPLW
jgi:hypothetical protein